MSLRAREGIAATSVVIQPNSQEPIMATRKNTTTKTAAPQPEATHAAHEGMEAATPEMLYAKARQSVEDLLSSIHLPSWGVRLAGWISALTASAVVTYGCITLLDMLVLGVASAAGGFGFLTFVVAFIGIVLTVMTASSVSVFVYEAVVNTSWQGVTKRVSSWFSRNEKRATCAA
jgi:hypothetical protein